MTALPEISALQFNPRDGLAFAAGTSSGHVLLYDLRSDRPLLTKDHQYGFAMRGVHYHGSGNMITFDHKIIKIWDATSVRDDGSPPGLVSATALTEAQPREAGLPRCIPR